MGGTSDSQWATTRAGLPMHGGMQQQHSQQLHQHAVQNRQQQSHMLNTPQGIQHIQGVGSGGWAGPVDIPQLGASWGTGDAGTVRGGWDDKTTHSANAAAVSNPGAENSVGSNWSLF